MVGFSSENWFTDSGFYPYEIGQSCRFDSASDEHLSRAPSSPGNKKTFTWSGWVKFSKTASMRLFGSGTATDEVTDFHLDGSDGNLRFRDKSGDNLRKETTAVLRDVGAWYHLVCAVDVTQASNSNRVKIYINGTLQTSFIQDDTFSNRNTYINRTGGNGMVLGKRSFDSASFLDGYMAEVHFIDGTQVTADSFGETKEGVWVPKEYTGSYGTNGFYLKFDQTGTGTASASTIGADSSGNNNHLTSTNLASIDSNRTDSPTNNFATWNPLLALDAANYGETGTLVNGALELDADDAEKAAWSTMTLPSSGKYYVEMRCSSTTNFVGGIMAVDGNINRSVLFQTDGTIDHDNAQVQSSLTSYTDGNTIGMRLDMDSGTIAFYLQDSAYGSAVTISSYTQDYALMCYGRSYVNFRTDPRDFAYSIPSGYSTLSTANLPEPTISPLNGDQPADHFNTVLYTGDDGTQAVTGVGFKPDFVWLKNRDYAVNHRLYNALTYGGPYSAGASGSKYLKSNATTAETAGTANSLISLDNDGFTVHGSGGETNDLNEKYVGWNWLGANGTASNSDGDITSTVSANTTAGFSIVTWTHSGGDGQTIGHGLGATPSCIIAKNRSTSGAWVIGQSDGSFNWTNEYYQFDSAAKRTDGGGTVFGASPTSSLFTFGTAAGGNGDNHLAYCFAEVEGYSDFGSYTGNGDADGPFIYTGFRPAFLMAKKTDGAENWFMIDNKRHPINSGDIPRLLPNATNAEATDSSISGDFLSNGFKIRATQNMINNNSSTYVYMAFAEMPFKYANGR